MWEDSAATTYWAKLISDTLPYFVFFVKQCWVLRDRSWAYRPLWWWLLLLWETDMASIAHNHREWLMRLLIQKVWKIGTWSKKFVQDTCTTCTETHPVCKGLDIDWNFTWSIILYTLTLSSFRDIKRYRYQQQEFCYLCANKKWQDTGTDVQSSGQDFTVYRILSMCRISHFYYGSWTVGVFIDGECWAAGSFYV